jgi:GNAT superfamily N-acetyltransferase
MHLFEAPRIESGKFVEIGGFVVAKEYQKTGIGKKTFESCERLGREAKVSKTENV